MIFISDLGSDSSVFHDDTHEDETIEALRFELDIIRVATGNFSETNKIWQSEISSMYKVNINATTYASDFANGYLVSMIMVLNHRNNLI